MKVGKLLVAAATLILCAGAVVAAATTPTNTTQTKDTAKAESATHHLIGTISSLDGSDVVVTHKYDGKQENSTFVMNSATKKEGTLAKGDQATIYYQVTNNRNVATDVKVNSTGKS
jgi:hypothetical protein